MTISCNSLIHITSLRESCATAWTVRHNHASAVITSLLLPPNHDLLWVQPNEHSGLGSGYFYKNQPVTESIPYVPAAAYDALVEATTQLADAVDAFMSAGEDVGVRIQTQFPVGESFVWQLKEKVAAARKAAGKE